MWDAMERTSYATLIAARMRGESSRLRTEFSLPDRIASTYVDNLLPPHEVMQAYAEFPDSSQMRYQNTIREKKYTLARLDPFPTIKEMLFAFHEEPVLAELRAITGLKTILTDPSLYAGGISRMEHTGFLQPHLDSSHDPERRYRVLNLLYYITPGWTHESGGNFELWDKGPKDKPREIVSAFNRLLIMATHDSSWHSVTEVKELSLPRLCISNYYFSPEPLQHPYNHVTYFVGRPEQKAWNALLRVDAQFRQVRMKVVQALRLGKIKRRIKAAIG